MIFRYILISTSLLFVIVSVEAQDQQIDSLKTIIETLKEDTTKVNALNQLSVMLWDVDPDLALMYSIESADLATSISYKKGLALALKNIGLTYYAKTDYINVLQYWEQSLAMYDSIGDKAGVSNLLNNIGSVYFNQGDETKAIEYFINAVRIAEEINNELRMISCYMNIGSIYSNKEETRKMAVDYYFKALNLSKKRDLYARYGTTAANIGEYYFEEGLLDSALVYFEKSLEAFEIDGESSIPFTLNSIGKLYRERGEYASSIKYHKDAYALSKQSEDKGLMVLSLVGLGNTYIKMKEYKNSLEPYLEAEQLANEIGALVESQQIYEGLSIAYAGLNNYPNAFNYQALLTEVNYELYNEANDKKIQTLQFGYEIDKRENEITQLTTEKALQESEMKRQRIVIYAVLGGLVLIMAIAVIMYRNYREKARINKILDKQNAEIESLILNILPKEIARELQAEGEATPRYYENVSVLFTDFKGFSSISKGMTPNELVEHLNDYFHAFDDIVGQFGLEKIKTIGDAYMCAGGIPLPNNTHPLDIVKAGLAMQEYINKRKQEYAARGEVGWDLRVGIHTGPIVAGVVGKKKYAYDIWGNTVNIASRMESNGEPGKVNISEATYNLVKDQYKCHHRGKIYAKNVGDIDMYFVEEEIPVEKEFESVEA
jgi:class 3 adenylate cyclase